MQRKTPLAFGPYVNDLKAELGIPTGELARQAGLGRSQMSRILAGKSGTTVKRLEGLAAALGRDTKEARDEFYEHAGVAPPKETPAEERPYVSYHSLEDGKDSDVTIHIRCVNTLSSVCANVCLHITVRRKEP